MLSGAGQSRNRDGGYRTLTETVLKYKEQLQRGDKKLADKLFQAIQQRLCHLVNQIVSIVTDTPYSGNQEVYTIVLEKMSRLTNQNNQDKLRFTCRRIVESQKLSVEDVRQQTLLCLLELIHKYVPRAEFIQYATYLLPRRVTQWLWRVARSASSQFGTVSFDQVEEGEEMNVPDPSEPPIFAMDVFDLPHACEPDGHVYQQIARAVKEVLDANQVDRSPDT